MKNKVNKHGKVQVSPLVEIIREYRGGSEENSMACLKAVRSALATAAGCKRIVALLQKNMNKH